MDREQLLERQRGYYRKHREKRLAAKKAARELDVEKDRARSREQYRKHQEKRVAYAREYRRERRAKLAEEAKQRYHADREAVIDRRKELRKRPEAKAKAYSQVRDWLKRHPDKADLQHAKRLLNEQTRVPIRDIPDDLAEAKVEQLKIGRWVREQISKSGDEA